MQLSLAEIVEFAIRSQKHYAIDFDEIWKLLGFNHRNLAARKVMQNLVENYDFLLRHQPENKSQPQIILLTLEGFKAFAAIAQSEPSREIRRYLILREARIVDSLKRMYKQQ